MRRIRVALGTAYPYDGTRIRSGVEAASLALVHALEKRDDIELHVVSCHHDVRRPHIERRGSVTFHWLRTGPRLHALRAATTEAWRVRAVYQLIAPDVVHAQDHSAYAIGAPSNIPLILTIHGVEVLAASMRSAVMYRGIAGLYRRVVIARTIRQSVQRADALVSVAGDYLAEILGSFVSSHVPIYSIANPVAETFFAVPELPSDAPLIILCPAHIYERKNQLLLVRALALVRETEPTARLVLTGDIKEQTYHSQIIAEIARLGLTNHVEIPGNLAQPALLDAYAQASIITLASVQETAPMAITQAQAAGRPVVATRVGGVEWLVENDVTGIVVEPNDVSAMATGLGRVLSDPLLRRRLGSSGRSAAERRFRAARIADQTMEVYRSLSRRTPLHVSLHQA